MKSFWETATLQILYPCKVNLSNSLIMMDRFVNSLQTLDFMVQTMKSNCTKVYDFIQLWTGALTILCSKTSPFEVIYGLGVNIVLREKLTLHSLHSKFFSWLYLLYSEKIIIKIDYSSDKYVQMALKALAMEELLRLP